MAEPDLDEIFALHDDPRIWVEQVGGAFPILYVEPFYRNPDLLREYALNTAYAHIQALYPGRHTVLATRDGYDDVHPAIREVSAFAASVISLESGIDCDYRDIQMDFSVITTPAQKLLKTQKHPHTDPNPVMAIVYLNPVPSGGTSLYRNRETGLAVLVTPEDHARHEAFMATAPDDRPQDGYRMMYPDLWERIHTIEGRYNCFAAYPPSIYHWAENTIAPDPGDRSTWRLTQRISIQEMVPGETLYSLRADAE